MANYYDILEVPNTASQEDIKKSFRTLSKKYHPDKNGGDDKKFKEINEAYSVLGDENKRREYDNQSRNPWGFNFGNFRRPMPSDINTSITISIEDAYYGCKRSVMCGSRRYDVDIPKGITSGRSIKVPGLGNYGYDINGKLAIGDLIIKITVTNTDYMYLNSDGSLEVTAAVDWIDAILGSKIKVKVFDKEVDVKVPAYTQNGGWTVVSNSGFPKFQSEGYGFLKINFIIKMPKKLTDSQVERLSDIRTEMKNLS